MGKRYAHHDGGRDYDGEFGRGAYCALQWVWELRAQEEAVHVAEAEMVCGILGREDRVKLPRDVERQNWRQDWRFQRKISSSRDVSISIVSNYLRADIV